METGRGQPMGKEGKDKELLQGVNHALHSRLARERAYRAALLQKVEAMQAELERLRGQLLDEGGRHA
jgi:hypothetical protein